MNSAQQTVLAITTLVVVQVLFATNKMVASIAIAPISNERHPFPDS